MATTMERLSLQALEYSRLRAEKNTPQRKILLVQERQLQLLGKILRSPEEHPLRLASFVPDLSFHKPLVDRYVRRQGRPNKEWIPEVTKLALGIAAGDWRRLTYLTQAKQFWNATLYNHFKF